MIKTDVTLNVIASSINCDANSKNDININDITSDTAWQSNIVTPVIQVDEKLNLVWVTEKWWK